MAEPVAVAAQAAQVVGAGGAGGPGLVVVEVAADGGRAAAGEAAASIAGSGEPLQRLARAVDGAVGRRSQPSSCRSSGAQARGVGQGEQLAADLLDHGDRGQVCERRSGDRGAAQE
ncbi:MAG: hypothetical protein M3Q22_17875, partial [Actinomycetota bacterium]|nr:hypothetical protein [Actinomycetota bacterium]